MTTLQPVGKLNTEPSVESAPSVIARERHPGRGRTGIRVLGVGAMIAVALGGALTLGTLPRLKQQRAVDAAASAVATALPRVSVVTAHPMAADADRVLPGSALPLLEASLYARATGFVKTRKVDIGDRVTEGQLLAVIDSPDIDDQLAQAQANLEQAKATLKLNQANLTLAKASLAMYQNASKANAVTALEMDQQVATVGTTSASVEAARASIGVNEAAVQRYMDLQRFEKITAPFPGVITARHIDPGDLITADSTARELFHVMRTDVLRVFVNVPQVFVTGIKVDQKAVVSRREDPAKQFPGKVTRTADALDPATRTLLTEVQVPNPDNVLRPGMYLQVKFIFGREVLPIIIPAAAVATRSGGPRVGVVDDQNRVHYRSVELGRDFGAEIQVITGLKAGETVIVHPGDDLADGTVIEPVPISK